MRRNYIVTEPRLDKRGNVAGPSMVRGNYQTFAKALAAKGRINRALAGRYRAVVVMRVSAPSRFNYSNVKRR